MAEIAQRRHQTAEGYTAALLSAFTFGLIPLFSVPLLADGMPTSTVLMYRFLFATVAMSIYVLVRGSSLRITRQQFVWLLVLSFLYFATAHLLLTGYEYISSGMATVLHFTYPIFVALLMLLIFRVRLSKRGMMAIMAAVAGVSLVSGVTSSEPINPEGPTLVITSGFLYAVYIIMVNKSAARTLSHEALTFYILLITTIFLSLYCVVDDKMVLPSTTMDWTNLILLGILSTTVSNITLVKAIDLIGSTPTAVMGALEPMTAVMVGVIAFGEVLTPIRILGILMILVAVVLLTTDKSK
nr:EamA family transporter [uncultured Porphyromonas sp.]